MAKSKKAHRSFPQAARELAGSPPSDKASERPAPADAGHRLPSAAAIRETIESIVVAFILAFLFRTFEAEAFVIPTGSMAPTLMGRHKDTVCPICDSPFQVSSSEEVEPGIGGRVIAGACPMCRYTASLADERSFSGDRILVGKLSYAFAEPERWDVIVFKYPANAATNFIKRLVGLPGETVRIQNGDVWIRRPEDKAAGDAGFQIARKPPDKLLAMLQPVFDNDYMPQIAEHGWPERWRPDDAGGWQSASDGSFSNDGRSSGQRWLRYHHLVPTAADWARAEANPRRIPRLDPQPIRDFTAYDTGESENLMRRRAAIDAWGQYWVGDLAVACTAEVGKPEGQFVLELRKGGRRFQCRFDLSTGRATLSASGDDMAAWRPAAATQLGAGRHEILFSNCDQELRLWVDGRVVEFDAPTTYPDLDNWRFAPSDLMPVGLASDGSAVRIEHLRVLRDIYYTAISDDALRQQHAHIDFSLDTEPGEPGRFFVLGDNSARSKDSRLWGREYWVGSDLLIGKAIFIYWPHSWNQIRTPWFNIPFPFFPNFARMGLVR